MTFAQGLEEISKLLSEYEPAALDLATVDSQRLGTVSFHYLFCF